jgi:hypothetical protein
LCSDSEIKNFKRIKKIYDSKFYPLVRERKRTGPNLYKFNYLDYICKNIYKNQEFEMKVIDILTVLSVYPKKTVFFKILEKPDFLNLCINIVSVYKRDHWETIEAARGGVKNYKSFDAVFSDIKKILQVTDQEILYRVLPINHQHIPFEPEQILFGRRASDLVEQK